MVDLQKTHEQFLAWVRSPAFDPYFEGIMGKPARWPLILGIVLVTSIVGSPIGAILLLRSWRDRRMFKHLRVEMPKVFAEYDAILCGIAIANKEALAQPEGLAPALLVGAFEPCTDELVTAIARAASGISELHGENPAQLAPELRQACELVNDDEYQHLRRRPVPKYFAGDHHLILFDAVLSADLLSGAELTNPFVVCMADPKSGGPIMQVPDHAVAWTESLSGAPIIRHTAPAEGSEEFVFDSKYGTEVEEHVERHLGKIETVFHELISTTVHVDIHFIPPGPGRPWITLVSSGMSDLAMAAPPGAEDLAHAELMLRLPPDWPMGQEAMKDEANYWPLRWMKMLVRFPHTLQTWLSAGHTIPNGDPPSPLHPSVKFIGWALSHPFVGGEGFEVLEASDGTPINFFSIIPLHASEMKFKLNRGWDELAQRMEAAGVTDLIRKDRPPVA